MSAQNAKSVQAAAKVNDFFSAFEWWAYRAYGTATAHEVAVEYKSRAQGCLRVVAVDGERMAAWLSRNGYRQGARDEFEELLDRKEETTATPDQPEFSFEDMPSIAKKSMKN